MSATRLPLLSAFAGGCLSSAVLFGLWRAAEGMGASSAQQQQQHRTGVVQLVTAASAAPRVEQPSELVAVNAAEHRHDEAAEPALTQTAQDLDSGGPTPAGNAVSDVLTRLEAAYRERVAARAPAQASSLRERVNRAAPADDASAGAEVAPGIAAQPVAEGIPAIPADRVATALEARAVAPVAVAPAAVAPVAVAPVAVAPVAPRPTEIHYGDVNQNTYITNIRQGDLYLIQMQQLAMLQYMQLLGMPSGLAAPARRTGGAVPQRAPFSSGISNPDNPWGFHFAPPNLVR